MQLDLVLRLTKYVLKPNEKRLWEVDMINGLQIEEQIN
jgi:hypothetical protein